MTDSKAKVRRQQKNDTPLVACNRRNPGFDIFESSCEVLGVDFSDLSADVRIASCAVGYKLEDRFMNEVHQNATISRFPGAKASCEKNTQCRMFDFARRLAPHAFGFWPETFVLP